MSTRPTRRLAVRLRRGGADSAVPVPAVLAVLAVSAMFALSACGSSANSTSSGSKAGSAASYTVSAAPVSPVGTVLVNGQGRTLYLLSSEAGGKLTCTDGNGCTKVWPDTELPTGVTQGITAGGVTSSLLSTVKAPGGKLYLTYGPNHWPLYTYSGDSRPGQARGQGIRSFGGTWSAISPSGSPAVVANSPGPSSSSGNGY